MLKISLIDSARHRRLVVEGKLIAPWAAEVKSACEKARADLHGRELVVEMKHVTTVSDEGERVVLELMKEGIKFRSSGVFTQCIMRQISRKLKSSSGEAEQ